MLRRLQSSLVIISPDKRNTRATNTDNASMTHISANFLIESMCSTITDVKVTLAFTAEHRVSLYDNNSAGSVITIPMCRPGRDINPC
jgi:hypothetical protein